MSDAWNLDLLSGTGINRIRGFTGLLSGTWIKRIMGFTGFYLS